MGLESYKKKMVHLMKENGLKDKRAVRVLKFQMTDQSMMGISKKGLEMEKVPFKQRQVLNTMVAGKIIEDMEMESKNMLMIVNTLGNL